MKNTSAIIVLICLFWGVSQCFAAPTFLGTCKFQQPNGTSVCFEHIVDEFGECFMTGYGPAVLNKDGYWYYGKYDENHILSASPYRVGDEKKNESTFNELRNENQRIHIGWYEKIYGKKQIFRSGKGLTKVATFTPRPLCVLLVQFSDTFGTYNYRSQYDSLLFSSNFHYTSDPDGNSTSGSMRDYYHSMSRGNYDLTGYVVNSDTTGGKINWIDLPYSYQTVDSFGMTAVDDTVRVYAIRQGIDYDSIYSSNNLAIIYAGRQKYNADGSLSGLVSHAENVSSGHGLYIIGEMSNYPNQEVFMTIGTHCHEYAHVLGSFPDDYRGSYPYGCWGLMCWGGRCTYPYRVWGGNCPSPLTPDQRYIIDPSWVDYTQITSPQDVTLTFNTQYGLSNVYELKPTHKSASNTESFFVENRQTGWDSDKVWNRGIPCLADSDGVLVWRYRGDNSRELIEADSIPDSSGYVREDNDAFRSNNKSYLTDFSSPSLRSISGGYYSFAQISNISASGNTMTLSLGDSRFGLLPENETWPAEKNYYIGGDFTIPLGKTLTLSGTSSSSNCKLYCATGKKIVNKGTLSVNWSKFTKFTTGTYWSGIDLDSTSVMNVNGDITIEYADCGLDINNISTINNGTNTITVQNCSTAGVSLNSTSTVLQNVYTKNCGSYYGGIMKSGVSYNPIVWRCTSDTSVHALYTQGNVVADSCNFVGKSSGSGVETVKLASAASSVFLHNSNILKGASRAVDTRTDAVVYARENWWGSSPLSPLSDYFTVTDTTYIKYLPVQTNSLAFAGVYKALGQTDPLEVAVSSELSGEFDRAVSIYHELINGEKNPAWKKFLITSLLRVHDNSDKAYADVKQIIDEELTTASGYHQAALKFIRSDILAREGKYQQAIDGFIRDAGECKGTSLEVEMLARVAEIYGQNLNDAVLAKQYAEAAAKLNPGQLELRNAFAAAGEQYNPAEYADKFRDAVENFDTPLLPKENGSELTEYISVSPNPANPVTTITYSIKAPTSVKLSVFSINGQKVATLVDGPVSAGVHAVRFDGSKYASGVYFYRFESSGLKKSGKMLLLK